MKKLVIVVVFACFAFPVFSQNTTHQQRFNALSDSMGATISRSNDNLADYDSHLKDNGDIRVYASYKKKYEFLVKSLQESEGKMDLLFRSNDRTSYIQEERNHYEKLIQQLQATKSDYDNFVRTVR